VGQEEERAEESDKLAQVRDEMLERDREEGKDRRGWVDE
jgi:hypothetical protein